MAKGVNKVILLGNVGQDPEVRFMPSGNAIANVSLATSKKWADKKTGEYKEETEWHRLVFYNKLAEIVGQYVKKGSKIYVEGELKTRNWETKEGEKKYTTEIIVKDMQMLDGQQQSPEQQQILLQPYSANFDDDIPF